MKRAALFLALTMECADLLTHHKEMASLQHK